VDDATRGDGLGDDIDLARLARPDADAFRQIAEMLGARYAGDDTVAAAPLPAGDPPRTDEQAPADGAAAALLERLPLPILVAEQDRVVFINKAARDTLGYADAACLDAAGGLGALFLKRQAGDGAVPVRDAAGRSFLVRAEMTPVDWAGRRSILVSLQPLGSTAAGGGSEPSRADLLHGLLSANPDPIAIVTRGGQVEAANTAYERLTATDDLRLLARLDAAAMETVLQTVAAAFAAGDGETTVSPPFAMGDATASVSAGVVPGSGLACLVFRRPVAAAAASAEDALPADPLERAAAQTRRLFGETSVAIVVDGDPAPALETEFAEDAERFFRAFHVAVGVPAPEGATVTVTRRGACYSVSLAPGGMAHLSQSARSARLVLLALKAGLALAPGADDTLTIAPLLARVANDARTPG